MPVNFEEIPEITVDFEEIPEITVDFEEIPEDPSSITDTLKSVGRAGLATLSTVGKAIDSVTGAPVRAAVGRAQNLTRDGGGIRDVLSAYKRQFAEDPSLAPTGKEIAARAGIDDKTSSPWLFGASPAGAAGIAVDIGTDPLSYLSASSRLSKYLRGKSEKLAVGATGATGVQAKRFAPNAGRELLDRKIVNFGSSPSDIANNAAKAVAKAEDGISSSLSKLDDMGAVVSKDDIIKRLRIERDALALDESQSSVVKKLNKIIEEAEKSPVTRKVSEVEKVKRGFQAQANYFKPNTTKANKAAARVYREAVEDSARAIDPVSSDIFLESKKTYGLLDPIQEVAEKRGLQLNQSPWGGLNDVASSIPAAAAGHPSLSIPTAIARKILAPRLKSSAAVTLDRISKGQKSGVLPASISVMNALKSESPWSDLKKR